MIPARGGSKRLPGKNTADVGGKPMLVYSIEAAIEAGVFDRVLVSTDDQTIAELAVSCGAITDIRPDHLATDDANLVDVCLDVLERESAAGRDYATLALLYATAPFRTGSDLVAMTRMLDEHDVPGVVAVTRYSHQPQLAVVVEADRISRFLFPGLHEKNAQEFGDIVTSNGSSYLVRTDWFKRTRSLVEPGMLVYRMPLPRSIDLDYAEDLDLIRLIFKAMGQPDHKC